MGRLSRILSSETYVGITLAAAALLTYNNWLLGPYLNRELFLRNGSVSEFSAITQPHHWIFRGLDILSGALLILFSFYLARRITRASIGGKVLIFGSAILGAANIFDALFALRCSETLNAGCSIGVSLSPSHFQMPAHGYSSVIIACCYLLLPLAGFLYGVAKQHKVLIFFSAVAAAMALESLLSAIFQYLSLQSLTVHTSGTGQEIQMLALAVWYVCLAFSLRRPVPKRARQLEAIS